MKKTICYTEIRFCIAVLFAVKPRRKLIKQKICQTVNNIVEQKLLS